MRKTNKQYAALAVATKIDAGADYYGLVDEEKDDSNSDEDDHLKNVG